MPIAAWTLPLKKISRDPCWEREARDIHKRFMVGSWRVEMVLEGRIAGKSGVASRVWGRVRAGGAPFPVRGLWTACTRLKRQGVRGGDFWLTARLEGVKR